MPDDLDGATEWLEDHRAGKGNPPAQFYPAEEVHGDSSEARFERFTASERYTSGQIATLQKKVIPHFVGKLSTPTDKDKAALEKLLFRANQHLLALRKEYRAIVRRISDIEFKRENLHRA